MDNFKVIYRILKTLEAAMDFEEPDLSGMSHEALGITPERWTAIILLILDGGYVEGATRVKRLGGADAVKMGRMRITLRGLEYLAENSFMRKAANIAKGIIETVT